MAKKKAAPKRAAGKKAAAAKKTKAAPAKRKAAAKKPPSLGRPKVTADEPLYLLFKEDYHARQIFEFLRVNTVRELEQYSAADIIKRLSQPVRDSVERIRHRLADHNRCLAGDLEYALEQKE
jgi:hypothetical protein